MFDALPLRQRLLPEEVEPLRQRQLLIESSHRRRPRYFDGRFLAARDLTADQAYFLGRQAAYARALGPGVVEGLNVTRGARGDTLRVSPGLGFTSAGELVSLERPLTVSLTDLPQLQALAVRLAQERRARAPLRNRSGTFALLLRPLEFTANPLAAYPSGLEGERRVEAGDIVEASALLLHPLNEGDAAQLDATRIFLARHFFLDGGPIELPPETLPLAVVAVVGDQIRWIDEALLRRRAGQATADALGFGFAPRPLREAHLAQYRARLDELRGRRFAAAEHFEALPPAGPLPDEAIDPGTLTQQFFPPGIDCELSLLPEDELPALAEASLLLPPIDLRESAQAQAFVRVSLLLPLPRARLAALQAELADAARPRALPPRTAFGGLRLPADRLRELIDPFPLRVPPLPAANAQDAAWRRALEAARGQLWYVRQRHLQVHEAEQGRSVSLRAQDEDALEGRLSDRLRDFGMLTRYRELASKGDVLARAELVRGLSVDALASPVLMGAALQRLEGVEKLDSASVVRESAGLAADSAGGSGLSRLADLKPELMGDRTLVSKLAADPQAAALDAHLERASPAEVQRVADALSDRGRTASLRDILRR